MRAVVQRVSEASVAVDGEVVGQIGKGFLVLLGAGHQDTEADVDYLVNKITGLRVFEDDDGKMNLALKDVGGSLLVVSQFTLFGDTRKGRRPSFVDAMEPGEAERLYEEFVSRVRKTSIPVETGVFAASMKVRLLNDGPVTLILETREGRGVKLAE